MYLLAQGLSPLTHRPFRWLLTGSAVNMLGNAFAPVALAFAVLDLGGRATELGLVLAAYAIAEVTSALMGGVLGDRLPRSVVLTGSNAGAAAIQAVVASSVILGWSSVSLLMILGAVHGALGALGGPASRAIISQTVPTDTLTNAVALRRLGQNLAQIIGYALAGMLVVVIGAGETLALSAGCFALGALAFSRIRTDGLPPAKPDAPGLLSELGLGLREVLAQTWLWVLIVMALVYHLLYAGAQGILGPVVIEHSLGRPAWGWALSALMAGLIVGGLISLRWRPRRLLSVGVGFLALTPLFPAAIAYADSLILLTLSAFLHGVGLETFSVAWEVAIQHNVAPNKLSRVYALDLAGSFVARPLGLALTGPIAEHVGYRSWLAIVSALLAALILGTLVVPAVRRLRRPQPQPDPVHG